MRAVPDKSLFFLTRVKFLGHILERNTITPLKSRIDAIQKLQPPSNKKKITRNCLSRNTPIELLTRKTTVEIPQNINFFLHKMNSHQD